MSNYNLSQDQYNGLPDDLRQHLANVGIDSVDKLNEIEPSDLDGLLSQAELDLIPAPSADPEPEQKGGGLFGGGKKKDKEKAAKTESKADRSAESTVLVRVVAKSDDLALVEWQVDRDLYRAYVPHSELTQSEGDPSRHEIDQSLLKTADPYGEDWAGHFESAQLVTPEDIARALREAGIWTYEDLSTKFPQAQAAYNGAHSQDFARFFKTVRAAHTPQEE